MPATALLALGSVLCGCRRSAPENQATIMFTQVPRQSAGGPGQDGFHPGESDWNQARPADCALCPQQYLVDSALVPASVHHDSTGFDVAQLDSPGNGVCGAAGGARVQADPQDGDAARDWQRCGSGWRRQRERRARRFCPRRFTSVATTGRCGQQAATAEAKRTPMTPTMRGWTKRAICICA